MKVQLMISSSVIQGGRRTATIRVTLDASADLMALDGATFRTLLAESELTRETVERAIQTYLGRDASVK